MSCAFHRLRSLGRLLRCIVTSEGQSLVNHSHIAAKYELAQVRSLSASLAYVDLCMSCSIGSAEFLAPLICRGLEWLLELQAVRRCFTRDC